MRTQVVLWNDPQMKAAPTGVVPALLSALSCPSCPAQVGADVVTPAMPCCPSALGMASMGTDRQGVHCSARHFGNTSSQDLGLNANAGSWHDYPAGRGERARRGLFSPQDPSWQVHSCMPPVSSYRVPELDTGNDNCLLSPLLKYHPFVLLLGWTKR